MHGIMCKPQQSQLGMCNLEISCLGMYVKAFIFTTITILGSLLMSNGHNF